MLPGGGYASVYYDPFHRNYGYWDSFGHWVMWTALLNSGGANRYYYYDNPGSGYYRPTYASSSGSSFLSVIFGLMLLGVLIAIGMYLYYKHAAEVADQYQTQPAYGGGYAVPAPTPPISMSISHTPPPRRSASLAPWLNFPPNSFIVLSDSQSMADSQKRGQGYKGIRYAVEGTATADDSEGFGTWAFITLNDQHQKLLLMVKSVDEAIDYRIYYVNEDFTPARREDVIRRSDLWLFEPPQDENNFDPADLLYSAEIVRQTDAGELVYVRKPQGERQAAYKETPPRSGATDLVATIVEYSTAEATDNPELLVLEIGAESRRTGEVTLYLGCPIKESEIDVLKA